MKTQDYMVRATAAEGMIRAFALRTTELTRTAQSLHNLYPIATAALGRTMTIGLVMGAMLKGAETITIQIKGKGPLKGLTVVCDSQGSVRGYVQNPFVHLPLNAKGKLSVGEAVGAGNLYITRDMGLREPYQGIVPLQTGEIGDDFAYYYAYSEQTPSVVGLGVLVDTDNTPRAAGGYLLQLMPGVGEDVVTKLEKALEDFPAISTMIDQGNSPEQILELLLGDFQLQVQEQRDVRYSCSCTKDRFGDGLIALGYEELESLCQSNEPVEIVCQFCSKHYIFEVKEIDEMVQETKSK